MTYKARTHFKQATALTTLLIVSSFGSVALAQTAPTAPAPALSNETSDVVIVTARKREESIQSIPLSVTAFSAKAIEARGLNSIADVATQTPGFSFRSGFGRTFDRPVIRGMSTIQGTANAAFFIDGVFVTGSIAGYGLDNLERIEVIKGPQSAQFGRSSFAGAVNYITRKPSDVLHGKATMTLGSSGRMEASGFLSGPLFGDKLKFEVNARGYNFGGQYTNEIDPGKTLGAETTTSYGLGLFFKPFENLEFSYRGTRIHDQDGVPAFALIGRTIGQSLPLPAGALQTNGINCFNAALTGALLNGRPVSATRARGYYCGAVPTPTRFAINSGEFTAAGFPFANDREIERNVFKARFEYNDWLLNATYANNNFVRFSYTDQDYSDLRVAGFEGGDRSGSTDISYDIRLASPSDKRLRGQIGYYSYEEEDDPANFTFNLLVGSSQVPFTRNNTPSDILRNPSAPSRVENKAWYGSIDFDITDKLTIGAEVRSQTDTIGTSGLSTATVNGVVFTRSLTQQAEFKSVLPRYTASYKVSDDILLYGVAAKGNKPGGVNTGAFSANYTDTQVAEFQSLGLASFKEEEIWSYELGAKTTWFENKLILNAAAYYIDWTNQQLTSTIAVQPIGDRRGILGSLAFNINAGQSEIKGLELSAVGRPVDWLELRLGYGLQDTNIVNFINDDQADLYITAADIAALNAKAPATLPVGSTQAQRDAALAARIAAANELIALRGNAAGNELPRSPKHQLQLGATVFQNLANGIKMTYRADYSWESKRFIQVDNLGWSPPLSLLNLRASALVGRTTFSFWADNALDDDTPVDILRSIDTLQTIVIPTVRTIAANGAPAPTQVQRIRDFLVSAPRKRTFGITMSVGF